MASALTTAFGDFVTTTGPAVLHAEAINEAQEQTYLLRRFMRGKGPEEILQGGQYISEQIMFDENTTAQFYHPNQTFTWENPQVLEQIRVDWRFLMDHMSWTDQEIELNAGGLGRGGRFHQFKRLKRIKEMRMWTSLINLMERHIFATPEVANMESASGKQPFSIPAFINEQTDGLFYKDATPTGKTAWTNVEGLDPTTLDDKWEPKRRFYDSSTVNDPNNIISEFDEMFLETQFQVPPSHEEYFTNPRLNSQFIACSKRGQTVYQQLLRESQDTFVTPSRQDPAYMNPKASGIDIVYVPYLDRAALYAPNESGTVAYQTEIIAGAGGTSSGGQENSGPRYYWINGWFMKPVFHTSRYFYKHPIRVHPNQPTTHIMPVECWYNFVCTSRMRQGIVAPSLDVYAA